jgi:hypothetical protein
MHRVERVVGDHGENGRISVRLRDIDGQLVTTGSATIRIGGPSGLIERAIVHRDRGVWDFEPQEGDFSAAGTHRMEVRHSTVTAPAGAPGELFLRPQVSAS